MVNTEGPWDVKAAKRYHMLDERLKVLEGCDAFGLDALDMCLVSDVVIPPKFKISDFNKYKRVSCPKTHLTMYYQKMVAYSRNDQLFIHCFQDSLSGESLEWYIQLEQSHIHTWKDLAMRFLKHYQYNTDMVLVVLNCKILLKRVMIHLKSTLKDEESWLLPFNHQCWIGS